MALTVSFSERGQINDPYQPLVFGRQLGVEKCAPFKCCAVLNKIYALETPSFSANSIVFHPHIIARKSASARF